MKSFPLKKTSGAFTGFALAGAAVVSMGLTGCASQNFQIAKQEAMTVESRAKEIVAQPKVTLVDPFVERDTMYVRKKPMLVKREEVSLPASFLQTTPFAVNPRESLRDVATTLSRATGMAFTFAPDIVAEAAQPSLLNGYRHEGSLKALLDQMAAQNSVAWRYRDGQVEFYRYETRVFHIAALATMGDYTTKIASQNTTDGGSKGGSQNNSGQSNTITSKTDFWGGVKEDLRQMIGARSSVSVSPTMSTVTATGTPQELATIQSYIDTINDKRGTVVMVSTRIYSVTTDTDDNYGVNWNAVYNSLSSKVKLSYVTNSPVAATAALTNMGNLTAILDPNGTSPWANSQALVQALSTQGTVSLETESSVVTVSGNTVPTTSLKEQTYLASVSTNSVAQAGTTSTTLTPDKVTVGISLQTTPQILQGDEVLLQEAIDLSTLDDLKTVSSGSGSTLQSIQTPVKSSRSTVSQVKLKSGQTLIMTGFQMLNSSYQNSGIGSSNNAAGMLAGGGQNAKRTRTTFVVLVTPVVMRSE